MRVVTPRDAAASKQQHEVGPVERRLAADRGHDAEQDLRLEAELQETRDQHRAEVESLGLEMQRTYEELALLHTVSRNLQLSRSPTEIARLCLERVHLLSGAAGTAIWIEPSEGRHEFLVEGRLPLDEIGVAHLVARYEDHDWSRPLVRNNVTETRVEGLADGLDSFVVVPIAEGEHRSGWIVCCNAVGREFGTEEASLLNSVATLLGTHVRNIHLYREHERLLLGFVQSMVFTLDAKDPYTRGHSERVARVARRLALEVGLSQKEADTVHLSGVLHDVGKIGIDDRVLRKPGRLTPEEFEHIKEHPVIGYNILYGIDNLRHVLPGVRNHHENWDGTGYPDGLRGEEIPLMARVIAVADAFDAMGGDRPYRKGMPIDKVESILREGAGRQWDARVVDAYFRARKDVRLLSERRSVPPKPAGRPTS